MRDKQLYEFGSFRIDVALSRLERSGQPVSLPPKAFDLLLVLARNTDRVMSKTELIEALWPNTFVEEANLTQHVYTLRKTLGDQPGGEPYIETVPRRGYRLAARMREAAVDSAASMNVAAAVKTGERVPVPGSPSQGERKHTTVMDCRIANAASLIERLDPDAMGHVIRTLMNIATEETGKYEGLIHAQHPEGFVALFGAHAVHEDDGRRAVLAALGIQQRALMLAAPGDDEAVDLRIGINTGPLVVSRAGSSGELSAVGDAARLASLLQQVAGPGSILVGAATRRAIEGYIDVNPDAVDVAGTPAFSVRGPVAPRAARPARFARTLAPFVGRDRELAVLDGLGAQAREGKGQVVSLVGEPGIGKSRLLHEFVRRAAAPSTMELLEARCVSYGSLVPYLPLADLIRSYCGVSDNDTPDAIRLAVERSVRDHDLPRDAGAWLLRLIGIVEGPDAVAALSPEAIKARTFEALRTLFFKASARAPLVIVIEDAHWIDRTSEEFLNTLIERIVAAPVMLIVSYRPGYRPLWLDRSYLTQITLRPLDASDGALLVDAATRGRPLPAAVSAAILEKGEGNPFFLEELARTVVEHGPDAQGIPDTVHGVIMARLDRLPDTAKHVLQTASIIGRDVPLPVLAAVWRGGDSSPALADLCRLEFLYERQGIDERVLVFKHALTQDVAYDSLLARTRRELHLRAAEALVQLYGDTRDDLAATFAYHYARTDLIDETVHWLTRAADRAAKAYANAEAILHLDLAARRLQRLPETPDRDRRMLDVALRHAQSLYFLGRFPESVEVLLPHEARLARLDDPALTAAFAFWLAHMQSRLGDQRRACDSAARAIEAATRAADEQTLGKAHGLLALEGHWSGNTADGIDHGTKAVRLLCEHPSQRWWLGMAHFYLAMNHLLRGDVEPALNEAARADDVGREIGDPRLQTYAGFMAGWVEVTRGNHALAVAACRRSRELAPDRVSRAYASMVLGYALLGEGRHRDAQAVLEPVVVELEGFGFPQWQGFAAALTADTYRLDDQLVKARALVGRALDVTTRAQYWYGVGFAQRVEGRIARAGGEEDDARAALDRAARTFERIGAGFEARKTREELAALRK